MQMLFPMYTVFMSCRNFEALKVHSTLAVLKCINYFLAIAKVSQSGTSFFPTNNLVHRCRPACSTRVYLCSLLIVPSLCILVGVLKCMQYMHPYMHAALCILTSVFPLNSQFKLVFLYDFFLNFRLRRFRFTFCPLSFRFVFTIPLNRLFDNFNIIVVFRVLI